MLGGDGEPRHPRCLAVQRSLAAAAHWRFGRDIGLRCGQLRVCDQTIGRQRAVGAGNFVSYEERCKLFEAGDHTDMGFLDVEEERAAVEGATPPIVATFSLSWLFS